VQAGEVVGGRFRIEAAVGRGGMATVYRASDLRDGSLAAVKQVRVQHGDDAKRFLREAQLLQRLSHPGLVGYRAHGMARDGSWFLAMEWVGGQNLAQYLRQRTLELPECLELGRRLTEVLSAVHGAGVVHRDLKPANVMIPEQGLAQAKLVDFGVAHLARASLGTALTNTGALIGTPGYLSPEQALAKPVDARTDLFALGCVLFECLSGRAAFEAPNLIALLARITLAPIEPLRTIRPELPLALEQLVMALLEKAPADRPPSAENVRSRLEEIARGAPGASAAPRLSVTPDEQRLISVVAASFEPGSAPLAADGTWTHPAELEQRVRQLAEQHGATLELLPGALVAVLDPGGTPQERAWRAALLARALQPEVSGGTLVVATRRGVLQRASPVGQVIDLAVAELACAPPGRVLLDETSASLLEARAQLVAQDGTWVLANDRRESAGPAHELLGRATPFVGRRRELDLLTATHEECASERTARAVLVTGDPGLGKSRLCREFLRELEQSGQRGALLFARGDPMRSGSAYAMIAIALRAAAGIRDDDSAASKRAGLVLRLREVLAEPAATRVAALLGELAGVPFSDGAVSTELGARLRAARFEPSLMKEQVQGAFLEWLEAEAARGPCLLVLEDLHWGDRSTLQLVDAALEALASQPLMVLALARPEVHDELPRLRESGRFTELRLSQLSKKASSDLVHAVLAELPAERTQQLIERAAGNPFFLEELLRAAALGSEQLPETVLGMLEVRIARLDPAARLVLRAASVFGEVFWREGLLELLGNAPAAAELAAWLNVLGSEELIARERASRFKGREAYRFRHALLREASYAMLPAPDRAAGHQLAGQWLQAAGEDNALILAEHFERGGAGDRAAGFYLQASQRALHGNDLSGAVQHAERGAACGRDPVVLGELLCSQSEAQIWMGQAAAARQSALAALELLPPNSAAWCNAIANLGDAALILGTWNGTEHWVEVLGQTLATSPEVESSRLMALGRTAFSLALSGRAERAGQALELAKAAAASPAARTPLAVAHFESALAIAAILARDRHAAAAHYERAAEAFESVGAERLASGALSNVGNMYGELGDFARAVEVFERALTMAERSRSRYAQSLVQFNLGIAWSFSGRLAAAIELEQTVVREFEAQGDVRLEGSARCALSDMLLRAGALDQAEAEARRGLQVVAQHPPARAAACAALAFVLLETGRENEALTFTREGMTLLASTPMEEREAQLRLCHAEALLKTGERAEARSTIEAAARLLHDDIGKISDPALRQSFEAIREHRRILELQRELLRA